jgi:tRNA pseudouridine-54 N-methylase
LANAVAASLGTPFWGKAGVLVALLLTGTGVGLGVWGYWPAEPTLPQAGHATRTDRTPTAQKAETQPETRPSPEPRAGATVTAILRGVDPETRRVTLRARETDQVHRLADGVDIRIDGVPAGLADLAALGGKTPVKVTLNAPETEVVSLRAEGEVVTGTLLGIDATRNTITLRRRVTDPKASASTWPLSPGATVTLDGQPATIAQLREGAPITAQLSADGKRIRVLDAKSP